MNTPWGQADYIHEFPSGNMIIVGTPSHGGLGIKVGSPYDKQLTRQAKTQAFVTTQNGYVWFEEDCAWAIPLFLSEEAFNEYTAEEHEDDKGRAKNAVLYCMEQYYDTVKGGWMK